MIIVLRPDATKKQREHLFARIEQMGFKHMVSKGAMRTIIGLIGPEDVSIVQPLEVIPGVERVMPVLKPYKLVSREFKPASTVINVKGRRIGGRRLAIMAGPCSVDKRSLLAETARSVKRSGAQFLRGGAFKPRTSPYAFQGLREEGLKLLRDVADRSHMQVVTELVDARDLRIVEQYTDVIQIGARNMHNYELLKEVGLSRKPVLLKRGLSATIEEFMLAAEYILSQGNFNVALCERGIRTFETQMRFTLDLGAVPVIKKLSHLPIIVDPSHPAGSWEFVSSLAKAAVAVGADGLLVEVHAKPEEALSDGPQSLLPKRFASLMKEVRKVAAAVGRSV